MLCHTLVYLVVLQKVRGFSKIDRYASKIISSIIAKNLLTSMQTFKTISLIKNPFNNLKKKKTLYYIQYTTCLNILMKQRELNIVFKSARATRVKHVKRNTVNGSVVT